MSNELKVQPTPIMLLEKAIGAGLAIEQLEKLMDMQERWEKKEARKSFLDALSKFQTLVPDLKKGKTANIRTKDGGNVSYKYADLGAIANAIKVQLNDCGLSYRWEFMEVNGEMTVTCLVSHRDGHTETTSMKGEKDSSGAKNSIQQKGSTHTYLQRYTLIGALGLTTADSDNDGKSAAPPPSKKEELSPEEIKEQWRTTISDTKSKIALQNLYLRNKNTVDADPALQEMFKARQEQLKSVATKTTILP
jgi:hypothetical protein